MSNSITTTFTGAAFALIMMPFSALADMQTVRNAEIAHLEAIEDSGYMEFYQHPNLGSYRFRSIYIEPVVNAMPVRQIYDYRFRPEYIDGLAADYHAELLEAFSATGLLTDEPGQDTLVISPSLVFVTEYGEESTGSNLSANQSAYRIRGNTIMEMTWHAGTGGEIVGAIRDGRTPYNYASVTDREDRFTDARDTFKVWARELAVYFGADPQAAVN